MGEAEVLDIVLIAKLQWSILRQASQPPSPPPLFLFTANQQLCTRRGKAPGGVKHPARMAMVRISHFLSAVRQLSGRGSAPSKAALVYMRDLLTGP